MHSGREAIVRFLKIVRERFSLPYGELPDLEVHELDKYLMYLLNEGRPRPSCQFPRTQAGWVSGFPKLIRLGRRQRWDLAQSLASCKRGLRSMTCQAHPPASRKKEWMANACRNDPPPASQEYLKFVRMETRKIFAFGWDKSYDSFCRTFVPKRSARKHITDDAGEYWSCDSWEKFQSYLRGGPNPFDEVEDRFSLRYKEVPTVGKVRPMGIPHYTWDLLGPLHKAMYSYIAGKEWCLRGPPTEKDIAKLCGGWSRMTSVDLVSATDGLRIDVAEAILGVALAKSAFVPGKIRCLAAESLRPTCEGKELTFGQNMGTYLSFPLLCLQSYLAARWATRDCGASIRVNGDDCAIASSRYIFPGDYPEGFQMNDKKIIRSPNAIEINSTAFLRCGERWREVRSVRRGAAYPDLEGLIHSVSVLQNAGKKWIEAGLRSRVIRKGRPSQLGVDLSTPALWAQEERSKVSGYRDIIPVKSPETRFERLYSEPTEGDSFAFHKDLFEGMREVHPRRSSSWGGLVEGRRSKLRRGVDPRRLLSRIPFGSRPKLKERVRGQVFCYSTRFEAYSRSDKFEVVEEDGWTEFRLLAYP